MAKKTFAEIDAARKRYDPKTEGFGESKGSEDADRSGGGERERAMTRAKKNGARGENRRDEAATDHGGRETDDAPSRGVRPEEPGVTAHDAGIDLADYGVQTLPPSKVPPKTKRIFDAPLDDAMLARIIGSRRA